MKYKILNDIINNKNDNIKCKNKQVKQSNKTCT